MSEDLPTSSYLDPRDREYVATLDGEERKVVLSAVARYRHEDRLGIGDPVPPLAALRLDDGSPVGISDLVAGRPLVLVFGSFT